MENNLKLQILGNGTSVYCWDKSEGQFIINKIENNGFHLEDDCIIGEIYVFGDKTLPEHCSDFLIEETINQKLVYNYIDEFIKLEFNKVNYAQPSVIWSERNRQPENGWAFYIWAELGD